MAGAISEIAQKTMFKNFRRIKPEESKIFLVEAAPRILHVFPEKLSKKAKEGLEKLGVTVIEGKKVTNITEDGVQVEETFYPCKNIIWAAGNQASPLLKTLDVPLDRQGRVIVEPDLSIPGSPEIFVIGDASTTLDKKANHFLELRLSLFKKANMSHPSLKNSCLSSKELLLSILTKEALPPSEKEKPSPGSVNFNSTEF